MKLHQLKVKPKPNRRRAGRGIAAGRGKTAGRGTKGQGARSGVHLRPTFEGGQNPLVMRLPKQRGFHSHRPSVQLIKTGQLNRFKSGQSVGLTELVASGLARFDRPIRLVKGGDLAKPVKLAIHGASQPAVQALKNAGGSLHLIDFKPAKPRKSKPQPESKS